MVQVGHASALLTISAYLVFPSDSSTHYSPLCANHTTSAHMQRSKCAAAMRYPGRSHAIATALGKLEGANQANVYFRPPTPPHPPCRRAN